MTLYNMSAMIIEFAGAPQDDLQSFLLYLSSICVSLIFIFFVLYIFKVMAGIINPSNYK